MSMAGIGALPPELYSAILDHLPVECLQHTVLSLTRTLPYAPIPQHHLFHSVRITRAEQVVQFYRRLRRDYSYGQPGGGAAGWVREFSLESWTADAEVVINLLAMLGDLRSLRIRVGPTNFTPEHLEELLELKPSQSESGRWQHLSHLEIRFRPYVQRATYQQFLKGSYFDSTLLCIARWPSPSLRTLSIVQDPMDPFLVPAQQSFAQPIVFFRLDPISTLLHAPSLSQLSSFRFRLPARQISRPLSAHPVEAEGIEVLDVGTSNILDIDTDTILCRFTSLKHIVADECAILRGAELREGDWAAFAKRLALVGARRAKEREKRLKAWLEVAAAADYDLHRAHGGPVLGHNTRKPRKGRRGLATATISLREKDEPSSSSSVALLNPGARASTPRERIRILPPPPTLKSLACANQLLSKQLQDHAKARQVQEEWEQGWAEGIAQLAATRRRLRQSASNGVRVVRFVDGEERRRLMDMTGMDPEEWELGSNGLEDVLWSAGEEVWGLDMEVLKTAPVLCLAGGTGPITEDVSEEPQIKHPEGCSHLHAQKIWGSDGM